MSLSCLFVTLKQAARITQPLLLAYGGDDRRVPVSHGRAFYDAVRQTNKNVEWTVYEKHRMMYDQYRDPPTYESVAFMTVYEKEGHGWSLAETRVDFWKRAETFLQQHIGDLTR